MCDFNGAGETICFSGPVELLLSFCMHEKTNAAYVSRRRSQSAGSGVTQAVE